MKLKFAPDLVIQVGHVNVWCGEPVSTFQPKICWQHVECVCLLFIFVVLPVRAIPEAMVSQKTRKIPHDSSCTSHSASTSALNRQSHPHDCHCRSIIYESWSSNYLFRDVSRYIECMFNGMVRSLILSLNIRDCSFELEHFDIHDQILQERVSGHQEPSGGWALAVVSCRWHRPCSNSC